MWGNWVEGGKGEVARAWGEGVEPAFTHSGSNVVGLL